MIKSAATLLGGNLGVALLKFVRNLVVARLLSVDDFGIVSTFAIIFALLDLVGFLGLDRLLIQAQDGDNAKVQATLQTMQVLRGALVSLLLYMASATLADLMRVPDLVWAFQLMSLMPLIQSFMHLDMARVQRTMNFVPLIKTTLGAEIVTLLAVYPLFIAFHNYRIGLYLLFLQQAMLVLLSHLVATRGYRLGFDREILLRAFHFGWPLLLNALLMFGIFQGDRIIVANRLGLTDLGLFSLAFVLTFMPAGVLIQTLNRLFLPKLASMQDDSEAFNRLAWIAVQAGLVVGLTVATGFSLFGPDFVLAVFGQKYAGALAVLVWLAVMQAVRIGKFGISTVALARAETLSPMIANIVRVLVLPLAWFALDRGAELHAVVWIAIIGELTGLVLALQLLRRWLDVPTEGLRVPILLWASVLVLICLDAGLSPPHPQIFANFHWPQIAIAMSYVAAVLGMADLRRWLLARLRLWVAPDGGAAPRDAS